MYDDADRLTEVRHEDAAEDALHKTTYVWTINNWVEERTEVDYTVTPSMSTEVEFEYDNRGRLISETRTVGQEDVYDISYTYDQLGNRETKYDAVTELTTEYTYDVELDPNDPNMPYATHNNRLLYYELYDEGQTPRKLLRTVTYTYYDDGDVSNITVKDEDPTGGSDPAYDRHRDLALYYNADKSLRVALWDSWKLNQYGNPTDYDPNYAHEFRYDGPLARYADAFYDELYAGQDPNRWPLDQTVSWSEQVGETIYNDGDLIREEDPNNPGEFLFDYVEQLHYLGPQVQESVATGDVRYGHGDLIESTMLTTDDYGAAASSVRYTAFGEILDPNGSPGGEAPTGFTRYQYAGGWSYESGLLNLYGVNPNLPPITLQHVGFRWYEPDIGRFVQRDPIGIDGGLNVYAYVLNHPVNYVDPSGLVLSFLYEVAKSLGWKRAAKVIRPVGLVISAATAGKKWGDFCQRAGRTIDPGRKSTYDTLAYYCLYAYYYPKSTVRHKAKKWWKWAGAGLGGPGTRVSCFVAGTEVAALRGPVAIEKLSVGDQVRSGHANAEWDTEGSVTSVGSGWTTELVHVRLDGETLKCTPEHPFWVVGRGWVKAGRLRTCDRLLNASGEEIPILGIQFGRLRKPIRVYNITANGSHIYHVGKNRVLVHNKMY